MQFFFYCKILLETVVGLERMMTMQPFINPNYFNQYMPYQNYQPSYMPQNTMPEVQSRCVNSFNEITAQDVPMNGISVFVKNDRSGIQLRQWGSDGRIITSEFEPKVIEPNNSTLNTLQAENEANNATYSAILDKINELADKFDKFTKPNNVRTKKEVAADD